MTARVLILAILLTGCAVRSRTLGTAVYPRPCWDARYKQQAVSGRFAHTYCMDKGVMFVDGKRAEMRWSGAQIQWEPVK